MVSKCNSEMTDINISTFDDMLSFIEEYENKGFYFRGECMDYCNNSCLPSGYRIPWNKQEETKNQMPLYNDIDHDEWIEQAFKDLGILPHISVESNTIEEVLINAIAPLSLRLEKDKLETLILHYSPDIYRLKKKFVHNDNELYNCVFKSSYLDISSDINVALHFVCSKHFFYFEEKELQEYQNKKPMEYGFLYVFDLKDIKESEFTRLVCPESYTYQSKIDDKICRLNFDRIACQHGAFLTPKRNDENICKIKEFTDEMHEKYLTTKIKISLYVKKELYRLYGGENGMSDYFPKLPIGAGGEEKMKQAYKDMRSITLLA